MKILKLGIIGMLFAFALFTACTKEETGPITLPAPENLHIIGATQSHMGVILALNRVEGAKGYRIYFNNRFLESTTDTIFAIEDSIGEFSVAAVDENGKEGERSPSIDNYAVESDGVLYERSDLTQGHYSGFFWNPDGSGNEVSLGDTITRKKMDFYLDDFQSGEINPFQLHFVSPTYNVFGDPFNSDTTWFALAGDEIGDFAPQTLTMSEYVPENPGNGLTGATWYYVYVDVNGEWHWAALYVKQIGEDGSVQFSYRFQPIPEFKGLKVRQ